LQYLKIQIRKGSEENIWTHGATGSSRITEKTVLIAKYSSKKVEDAMGELYSTRGKTKTAKMKKKWRWDIRKEETTWEVEA
jgi:hypothetical protein